MPDALVVLLAGGSGYVGGCVLEALLEAPEIGRVMAVTRRPLLREHPRLANRILALESLDSKLGAVRCDAAICCLGAPPGEADAAALRAAEYQVPLVFARAARAAGAQRLVVVSCAGAAPEARNPRLRLKAELEAAVSTLGFPAVDVLQPGAALGLRNSMGVRDFALLVAMPLLNPLLTGTREPLRGIPRRVLGQAAVGALRSGRRGLQRYSGSSLHALARLKAPRPGAPVPDAGGSERRRVT